MVITSSTTATCAGNVDPARTANAPRRLRRRASALSPLWAGVARNPALQHLRDKVESAVVRAGQPPEGRKFVPHITLARFKIETGHHLANFLAEHNLLKICPIRIDRFTLFQSHMKRDGSVYEPLADYPLVDERAVAALS